jgi:hypothetical protein
LGPVNKEELKLHSAKMASNGKVKANSKVAKAQPEEAHGYEFLGP